MDDNSPPPIPDRPGRAIHSIDKIKSEAKPNDYVDTTTITGAQPQRPPKLVRKDKVSSLKSKAQINDVEQNENITNELREHLQEYKSHTLPGLRTCPAIPPRQEKPPPVPPRDTKGVCHGRVPGRPVALHSSTERPCNSNNLTLRNSSTTTMPTTNNKSASSLPAKVLIISEESGFPQLSTSRRRDKTLNDSSSPQPVTQQPKASNVTLTLGETGTVSNTIICPECGQCRCSDCSGNRKLPERWLCEGNCRCSADSVVDALSCMWCVKYCFKTITTDNSDGSRVHPCACTESPQCLLRWSTLAALSLCLPCLCCYGPMQLGVAAATACYNHRKKGCRCKNDSDS